MDPLKRIVAGLYSAAAERFYEPVVVRGSFRLLAGDMDAEVAELGARASRVAGSAPVLDMPVGTAHFTREAARGHAPSIVVGVDIAEGMVRAARAAARDAGLDNLLIVRADAHRLPFRDEAFGASMCINGLQVMPGTARVLDELARVTRGDGALLVAVVHLPVGAALPRRAAARLPAGLKGRPGIVAAIAATGYGLVDVWGRRLATFIEARRPPARASTATGP